LLAGAVAVLAALEANSRPITSLYLRVDKLDPEAAAIERLARAADLPLQRVPADHLNDLLGESGHGGVVAEVGPRRLVQPAELIGATDGPPFIVLLDGVEDPYNLGQAIRSLYAAGATGLALSRAHLLDSTAVVVGRASAGASERLPIALADPAAVALFRQAGLAVIAAANERAVPLDAADLTGPLCLIIGGEKRGVGRALRRHIDQVVTIPYGRPFAQSLGAAAAAAVLAFEVSRQRRA
jgi:23S rRNA (guanosine2251-2'-O)-methyltransferase